MTPGTGTFSSPECRGGRVAFFGGSFDPPHLGHLAIARAAREALGLDRILFAPVGAQPLKPAGSTATFADRLAMTELAIAGEPGFEISLADAPSTAGRPNYTLETRRALRAGLPAHGCLFCLMGADSFRSLRKWRGAAEIPFAAALIVASRPGQRLDNMAGCLPNGLTLESVPAENIGPSPVRGNREPLSSGPAPRDRFDLRSYWVRNSAGERAPLFVLPGLDIEIRASDIRTHLHANATESSVSLPWAVANYIRTHGLYRPGLTPDA